MALDRRFGFAGAAAVLMLVQVQVLAAVLMLVQVLVLWIGVLVLQVLLPC